jgi:formylglycine-generating enzyme required for sulfatase activity
MAHIFISYSHKDSDYAHRLAEELGQKGFSVWIDDRIDYGTQWPRVIQEHLDDCSAFVVIMTPRSYQSNWVQNELNRAMAKGKSIFPLLLEGDDTWLSVQATQYVDVRDSGLPPERFYRELAERLGVRITPPEPVRSPRQPPPRVTVPEAVPLTVMERIHPFEPEMVLILAGKFLMGSDRRKDEYAQDDEQPQHTLYLPNYYLSKTPVTNTQYATFVQAADDHRPPKYWEGEKPPRGKEEHPVIYITWHDAMDYCRWLAKVTGKPYRLPSEAEWEKGARGSHGRIWPWGNQWAEERCNSKEGGKGDTTPVGTYYPRGASPYGLLDMAGNVLEWTRSLYRDYPYVLKDGREEPEAKGSPVLRGGAFNSDRRGVRCAARHIEPLAISSLQGVFFGFRVVLAGDG